MLKRCLKSVFVGILGIILCYMVPLIYSNPNINNLWNAIVLDLPIIGIVFVVFVVLSYESFFASNKSKKEVIDINSRGEYPANVLSNLHDGSFYFDGVYCASREGLLQAFKTQFVNEQMRLCGLSGREAQKSGQQYNNWKDDQFLYWKGRSFKRDSGEYQELLKEVFDPENMSLEVIATLLSTGNKKLVHSVGKNDIRDTVLTEQEFCTLMVNARDILREKGLRYTK